MESIGLTVSGRLQSVVAAGLTSTLAIAITTGMSDADVSRLLSGTVEPTSEQREQLNGLLREYERAARGVNAATLRARL